MFGKKKKVDLTQMNQPANNQPPYSAQPGYRQPNPGYPSNQPYPSQPAYGQPSPQHQAPAYSQPTYAQPPYHANNPNSAQVQAPTNQPAAKPAVDPEIKRQKAIKGWRIAYICFLGAIAAFLVGYFIFAIVKIAK